jgi:hypothetical protein
MLTAARMPENGNYIMGAEPFLLHRVFLLRANKNHRDGSERGVNT